MERNVLTGSYRFPAFDDEIIGNFIFYGRLIFRRYILDPVALAGTVAANNDAAIQASADMTQSNTEREMALAADSSTYNTSKSIADMVSQQTQ